MTGEPTPGGAVISDERRNEWVEGARLVLADDLPSGHKHWKSWALDLADQVLALAAALAAANEERDRTLKDVLWLIDCEEDAADTVGANEGAWACSNLRHRIEGHFHVDATALARVREGETDG